MLARNILFVKHAIIPQLHFDEFLAWETRQDGKFELHSGFVVSQAGATSIHNIVAGNAFVALRRCFPPPCKAYGSDMKVKIDDETSYYPDVSATCEAVDEDALFLVRPEVVLEVLSPSTRFIDLVTKRAHYRKLAGLRAYVIVHTEHRRVEVDHIFDGHWKTTTIENGPVAIAKLDFDVEELYAGTSLAATSES